MLILSAIGLCILPKESRSTKKATGLGQVLEPPEFCGAHALRLLLPQASASPSISVRKLAKTSTASQLRCVAWRVKRPLPFSNV
jgi:hypothetical protein